MQDRRLDDQILGLGLGLRIALDLVRLYVGEITLKNSAHRGLRATLRLPAVLCRAFNATGHSPAFLSYSLLSV
jgi:signal transduction histidine kinase